jgi:hypothetical protein
MPKAILSNKEPMVKENRSDNSASITQAKGRIGSVLYKYLRSGPVIATLPLPLALVFLTEQIQNFGVISYSKIVLTALWLPIILLLIKYMNVLDAMLNRCEDAINFIYRYNTISSLSAWNNLGKRHFNWASLITAVLILSVPFVMIHSWLNPKYNSKLGDVISIIFHWASFHSFIFLYKYMRKLHVIHTIHTGANDA